MAAPISPRVRGVKTDGMETRLPNMGRERDVRPLSEKIVAALHQKNVAVMVMSVITVLTFVLPSMALYSIIVGALFTWWALTRPETSPCKIPIQEHTLDKNEPHPATNVPTMGKGIFFIGNDISSHKEVWVTNDDCRQHFLVMGTTGAGKAIKMSEKVHTPDGWRLASDIKVGDYITTPFNSEKTRVSGVFPQGKRKIWAVKFSDGRISEVDGEHLWEVYHTENGVGYKNVFTTKEIQQFQSRYNHVFSIIVPDPIEKPHALLTVPTQTMGNLCKYDNKEIPEQYLNGSIQQRWEVLQGVLKDCSSWDASKKVIRISCNSLNIVDSLKELVWGLGGIIEDLEFSLNAFSASIRLKDPSKAFTDESILGEIGSYYGAGLFNKIDSVEETFKEEECVCFKVEHERELFIIGDYIVTHNTELLLSFSSNALSWGSGFLYVDGKADRSLYAKILVMCRRWGRDDDLLVLNFMTGDNSVVDEGGNGTINTNTMNPFANGSPDALVQLVVSLMGGGGGDNQMWVDRAQAMFTGMMYALVWLRDAKGVALGVGDIRDHLQLGKLTTLINKEVYPDMPERIVKSLKAYFSSLSGWNWDVDIKKNLANGDVTKQHGFLEMQFTKIFSSLVDVYSNIFNTSYGEIDVYDVVLNRRILVVMLPALEKAPAELASLGKIIVASLKGMMGSVLGSNLEGDWDSLVENRPTSSPSPFIVIFDEVGYYTVSGMAVMAAQGRSLGFSLVYASQDLNSLKRNEEKESESIIGNTNLKMLMRTEDKQTQELGINAGGKEAKITIDGYNAEDGNWDATQTAKANMEDVINGTDLKGQGAGYLHFIYKDTVIRARSFYADAPSSLDLHKVKLRPNHFIIVERGDASETDGLKRNPQLLSTLSSPTLPQDMDELVEYEAELFKDDHDKKASTFIGWNILEAIKETRKRREPFSLRFTKIVGIIDKMVAELNKVESDMFQQILTGSIATHNELSQDDVENNVRAINSDGGFFDEDADFSEDYSDDEDIHSPNIIVDGEEYAGDDIEGASEDELNETAKRISDPESAEDDDDETGGMISNILKNKVDDDPMETMDALGREAEMSSKYYQKKESGKNKEAVEAIQEMFTEDEDMDNVDDIVISSPDMSEHDDEEEDFDNDVIDDSEDEIIDDEEGHADEIDEDEEEREKEIEKYEKEHLAKKKEHQKEEEKDILDDDEDEEDSSKEEDEEGRDALEDMITEHEEEEREFKDMSESEEDKEEPKVEEKKEEKKAEKKKPSKSSKKKDDDGSGEGGDDDDLFSMSGL